ncbi:MAG: Kelch repeat-containing protein [Candidatus Heimdallarchaeota archaeon]
MLLNRVLGRNSGTKVLGLLFFIGLPFTSLTGALPPESTSWTNMAPDTGPSVSTMHAMAYDVESDRIILFGGRTAGGGTSSETWAYDFNSNAWTNMAPPTMPIKTRGGHAIAYDVESDRIILFGGRTAGGGTSSETWAYDFNSNTWTNLSPATTPPARAMPRMAYDAESDRIILFGGMIWNAFPFNDTWAYDFNSNTWTNMNPPTMPVGRRQHAMAYDAESDRVILFGGNDENTDRPPTEQGNHQDTWAYDYNSNTWTNMDPTEKPFPRICPAMAYNAEVDRFILFGGMRNPQVGDTSEDDDTWAYDFNTNTWMAMNSVNHPSRLEDPTMAYDAESNRIILYGGILTSEAWGARPRTAFKTETWVYEYPTISKVSETPIRVPILGGLVMGVISLVVFQRRRR